MTSRWSQRVTGHSDALDLEKGVFTLRDPERIPGVGLWISIQDTEGNRVSLLQPSMP